MKNFTPELLEKARAAASPEALLTLAKENGMEEFTAESAKAYFDLLHPATGAVSDDELANVSGGGCYNKGELVVTLMTVGCREYKCKDCGTSAHLSHSGPFGVSHQCSSEVIVCYNLCGNCTYCKYERGLWLCSNPKKRK